MATVTLRLDDRVRDQLQSMADGQGLSLSDLIRGAIVDLFDSDDRDSPRRAVVPESISAIDRRQLQLLHRILARLVKDQVEDDRLDHDGDTKYQLDRAEALEEGWTSEYDMEFVALQPELSRRDCGLVMDLLDMFRVVLASLNALPAPIDDDTARILHFRGFDANHDLESRLLGYARSLLADGKWTELADVFSTDNDRGNSHSPTLATYKRMLAVYEPIWHAIVRRAGRDYLLSEDELHLVADAAVHPHNRRRTNSSSEAQQ
jgi:uncharacterized protein YfbU (UPF0304 family)